MTTKHIADLAELSEPPEDWRAAVTGSHAGASPRGPASRQSTGHFAPSAPQSRQRRRRADPETPDTWQQRAEQAEQRVADLEHALRSRPGIEQAKGVLMAVFGLGADAAFAVLVRVSQHSNTRLVVIADQFVRRVTEAGGLGPATIAQQVRSLLDELATGGLTTPGQLPHESPDLHSSANVDVGNPSAAATRPEYLR